MSFVLLGILNSQAAAGGISIAYRMGLFGTSGEDRGNFITGDDQGNIYLVGQDSVSQRRLTTKTDADGTVIFTSRTDTVMASIGNSVQRNNVVVHCGSPASEGGQGAFIAYDLDGNVLRNIFPNAYSGSYVGPLRGIGLDSNGDVYTANEKTRWYKMDFATSSHVWGKEYTAGGFMRDVSVSGSDNFYTLWQDTTPNHYISKLDSLGNVVWQRELSTTDSRVIGADPYGDDVVLVANSTGTKYEIVKINANGTVAWSSAVTASGSMSSPARPVFDSAGNIYVTGNPDVGGGITHLNLAKIDGTNGNLIWSRRINTNVSQPSVGSQFGIGIDPFDNLLVAATIKDAGFGQRDAFYMVAPNDGSLTGTYGLQGDNYTYETGGFSQSSSSITLSTPSLSFSNFTQTYTTTGTETKISLSSSLALMS